MFWQLQLIYGDQFYPRLHQMYRVMSDADYPLLDSDQVITDREETVIYLYGFQSIRTKFDSLLLQNGGYMQSLTL